MIGFIGHHVAVAEKLSHLPSASGRPLAIVDPDPARLADYLLHEHDPSDDCAYQDDGTLFFIYGLRSTGAAGLGVIRDILRTSKDVGGGGWNIYAGGGLVMPPTRRLSLLEVLRKWPGPGAAEIDREVLAQTSSLYEALFAIRNLAERHETPDDARDVAIPGYRAVLERHVPDPTDDRELLCSYDVLRYYDAAELIPAIEHQLAGTKPGSGSYFEYWDALGTLSPSPDRDAAYARMLARPDIQDAVAKSYKELSDRDFGFAAYRTFLVKSFAEKWNIEQRQAFLTALVPPESDAPPVDDDSRPASPHNYSSMFDGSAKARPELATDASAPAIQGKLAVLSDLAPYLTAPALQPLAQRDREKLSQQLQSAPRPVQ